MADIPYVLVVEDDAFYANIYKTKLAKEKIEAQIVNNGNEALAAARARKPKLVLMDLIMPGKDGFETLADFKGDPALKDVKVIILSNLSQEEDMRRVMELGAAEYLVKANVPIQAIVDKVKSNLGGE